MIFNITRKPNLDVPGAKAKPKGGITIAGTLGKSAVMNGLAKKGRIDVGGIKGQWEAFKVKLLGANAWSRSSFGDCRYDFPETNARQVSGI
jgi:hypothetical protein